MHNRLRPFIAARALTGQYLAPASDCKAALMAFEVTRLEPATGRRNDRFSPFDKAGFCPTYIADYG